MKKLKAQFERAALLLLLVFVLVGGSCAVFQGSRTSLLAVAETATATVEPVALKLDEPDELPVVTTLEPAQVDEPQEEEPAPVIDAPLGEAEAAALVSACQTYDIDLALALGLIFVESSFNPDAVSSEGCYGLCQLNPDYFPSGLTPVENIETGMKFLAELLEKYEDIPATLTAYNAGHDTGDRTYANAVLSAAENWR